MAPSTSENARMASSTVRVCRVRVVKNRDGQTLRYLLSSMFRFFYFCFLQCVCFTLREGFLLHDSCLDVGGGGGGGGNSHFKK